MKTINSLISLTTIILLTLSSCATDENLLVEEQSSLDLLKSYTIKKDATGTYYLDYDLANNVKVDNVKNVTTNSNQFYLYSSGNESNRRINKMLFIEDGQLNIDFVDTNSDKQPKITIIDDGTVLGENVDANNEMLAEYSITSNENGTYNLDFKVKNKVEVDFVYNKESDIYEIHLEKGNGVESNYSKVLEKNANKPLKFDFVNHSNNTESRANGPRRKPRGIIGNGGDDERDT
ncbi:MAG: hypothetical protein ACPGTO_05545 [Polaribacter sp.]